MNEPKCLCGVCSCCKRRARRHRHPDKLRANRKRWKQSPKGRAAAKASRRRYYNKNRDEELRKATTWAKANPLKRYCYNQVAGAIRYGRLQRQPCSKCGRQKAQAHHSDYTKPFDITWLCSSCHISLHKTGGSTI